MRTAVDLAHKPVDWATQATQLKEIAKVMIDKAYSQLPIRDGERNVGRVTEDMICTVLKGRDAGLVAMDPVRKLPKSGKPFEPIDPRTTEARILELLEGEQAVLVRIGKRPQDWGIITRADFVKRLL